MHGERMTYVAVLAVYQMPVKVSGCESAGEPPYPLYAETPWERQGTADPLPLHTMGALCALRQPRRLAPDWESQAPRRFC